MDVGMSAVNRESPALRALAAWVFSGDASQLSWEMVKALRLENIAAPLLRERLPADVAADCKRAFTAMHMLDIKQEHALSELEKLFREHGIDLCPIKGAALAWRVWPSGAFRIKGDLDIWVRREDHETALELLAAAGWKTPYHYREKYHEAMMFKHGVALELHFLFPNFDAAATGAMLEGIEPISPHLYRLPLESNLLLLFIHSLHHRWQNGIQLLMDCGFLIRHEGKPDWSRLRCLAKACRMPPPSLLFRAFSEFFPPETMPDEEFPPEIVSTFRKLILEAPPSRSQQAERVMGAPERFSLKWWRDRISGFCPSSVRIQTGNPRGHYGKLLIGYWQVGMKKLKLFWQFRHGSADVELSERLHDEKRIEKFLS
jgi:hypothetical protein